MTALISTSDPALASSCARKDRYHSEQFARQVGQQCLRREEGLACLYVYPCAACRGWHLTRKPNAHGAVTRAATHEALQ